MEVMLAGCFVEDLETAKKFYMEKLGLSVMFESQGFCEVSQAKGGMVIGLSQSPRPSGQDGAVVCFKVADLPREQERLLKLGVKFDGDVFEKPGIVRIANFRDPFAIASNWSSICAHDEIARRKQLNAGEGMFIKKSPEESKEQDAAVVARAQAGHADALEILFASWRKPLFAFVYRMVTRREDAEDLTQEVFLRCLRGLASFRGESQFRTWLFGIATHVCLDYLREKQRWRVEAQMVAQHEGVKSSAHNQQLSKIMSDPGFIFDINEHIAFCLACVGRTLAPEEQAALLLRNMFGFTGQESADILEISEPVLRHRLGAARSTMATEFDGLCQLVNKTGVCYQCRGLRDYCAESHKGVNLVSIEVLIGTLRTPETLLEARLSIAREANLEDGTSSKLHVLFFDSLTRQEESRR